MKHQKTFSMVLLIALMLNTVALINVMDTQKQMKAELDAYEEYLSYLGGEIFDVLGGPTTNTEFDIHMKVIHRNAKGEILAYSEHAGTLTTIGKNYIEGKLGNNFTIAAYPSACWISLSNDAGAPSAAWTQIPVEIAANNMSRALGAYTSTGDGVWTVTYTFTASGAQSVQLAGLQWAPSGDGNLLCADQMSSAALIASDTLEVTWTITVT